MADEKKSKEPTFEQALERLETLVKEMESGALDLEKMMSHFEEGNKLVGQCTAKLNEVEKKIEVLVKQGEKLKTEPFESDEG